MDDDAVPVLLCVLWQPQEMSFTQLGSREMQMHLILHALGQQCGVCQTIRTSLTSKFVIVIFVSIVLEMISGTMRMQMCGFVMGVIGLTLTSFGPATRTLGSHSYRTCKLLQPTSETMNSPTGKLWPAQPWSCVHLPWPHR